MNVVKHMTCILQYIFLFMSNGGILCINYLILLTYFHMITVVAQPQIVIPLLFKYFCFITGSAFAQIHTIILYYRK